MGGTIGLVGRKEDLSEVVENLAKALSKVQKSREKSEEPSLLSYEHEIALESGLDLGTAW